MLVAPFTGPFNLANLPTFATFNFLSKIFSEPQPTISHEKDEVVSIAYTIYGKVQGVFFRKYTRQQAIRLGLRGWVMNTAEGTVSGEAHGSRAAVEQMSEWLSTTGSPKSQIIKADIQYVERASLHVASLSTAFEVRK